MMAKKKASLIGGLVCLAVLPTIADAQESVGQPKGEAGKPNALKNVYFGEQHMHTRNSFDAFTVGVTTTWDDAYRFAKGEKVMSSNGVPAQLERPLDFLVVADHAENLGLTIALAEMREILEENDWGRGLIETFGNGSIEEQARSYLYWAAAFTEGDGGDPLAKTPLAKTMWQRMTEAAERHNAPGAFTALIGYEWTSGPAGNNLHRNIIFRDGKDRADQVLPFSSYDSEDPEDLWAWMERYETETGGQLLAIPHNGNLSNGLMFDDVTFSGAALGADYAERRMRWEPIYEITQIKGDGETHPMLSDEDEFADYGTWDKGSFGLEPKTSEMLPREYAREAWKRGMAYAADLGANPFKFGVVGSTDSHTALSTAQEDNFFGKAPQVEPTNDPVRFEEPITGRMTPDDPSDDQTHAQGLASGLAAVWVRENTREAIWDALKRREVYATTGSRIRVRVFAGADFTPEDLQRSDFDAHGYANGVPMGSDLPSLGEGVAPTLLIRALRDPDGANLDRIQVVKGWVGASGQTQERVFDVACSGGREILEHACAEPVGNTVDIEAATYTNAIGAPVLGAWWQDPEFDPALRALYYVRVLEIPTPNWTTYDAAFFGISRPEGIKPTQQERAYTSPIWYVPG